MEHIWTEIVFIGFLFCFCRANGEERGDRAGWDVRVRPTASDLCSHCNMLLKDVKYLLQEHQVLIGVTACERRQQHLQTARLWHICRNEGNHTCPATLRRSGRRSRASRRVTCIFSASPAPVLFWDKTKMRPRRCRAVPLSCCFR